ncbi:hypothetical protein DMUE_1475 [Dictyocoela muelleri]|nr:hypothetical protein DMUE_1475 [Dictyocoela muelleri]
MYLEENNNEEYQSLIKKFKFADSLSLIYQSLNDVNSDTIVKCFKRGINDVLNETIIIRNFDKTEEEIVDFLVYDEKDTYDDDFLLNLNNNYDLNEEIVNIDSDDENINESRNSYITFYQANESAKILEKYFMQNNKYGLEEIYDIKEILYLHKKQSALKITDFLIKKK